MLLSGPVRGSEDLFPHEAVRGYLSETDAPDWEDLKAHWWDGVSAIEHLNERGMKALESAGLRGMEEMRDRLKEMEERSPSPSAYEPTFIEWEAQTTDRSTGPWISVWFKTDYDCTPATTWVFEREAFAMARGLAVRDDCIDYRVVKTLHYFDIDRTPHHDTTKIVRYEPNERKPV